MESDGGRSGLHGKDEQHLRGMAQWTTIAPAKQPSDDVVLLRRIAKRLRKAEGFILTRNNGRRAT